MFSQFIIKASKALPYLTDKIMGVAYKRCMRSCGKQVHIRPLSSDFRGLNNLSVGNNVSFPRNTTIYCTEASLTIGNNVIFGPKPTIITGDHRIDVIGKPIIEVQDKLPSNDLPVVIEDDVWCGANVVILKGVTIGRGSVVAAGSIVTKSCEPYSIIGGIPAKMIGRRFNDSEIKEHERILYDTSQL